MSVSHKSALCVVGLGFENQWISILKNGQEKTWLAVPRPDCIKVLHVHGRPLSKFEKKIDQFHEYLRWNSRASWALMLLLDSILLGPMSRWIPKLERSKRLTLRDPVVEVRIPDYFGMVRWKELSYFKYFLTETEADFLITTTNSSYLNLQAIAKKLQSLDSSDIYFGPIPYEQARFVSGSFRIFSRDVISAIVANQKNWRIWELEDVAIGRLLAGLGIQPTFIEINNLDTIEKIEVLSRKHVCSQLHFRLKSGTANNRNDIPLMKFLHSKLEKERR